MARPTTRVTRSYTFEAAHRLDASPSLEALRLWETTDASVEPAAPRLGGP
ncbi:MAG: hypothetical protein WBG41_07955 [Acidimicrobiales bacterium]